MTRDFGIIQLSRFVYEIVFHALLDAPRAKRLHVFVESFSALTASK